MRRILGALVVVAVLAGAAHAANKSCDATTLTPTPQTATGPSADSFYARAVPALLVQVVRTAGAATVALQVSCDDATWAPVGNGTVMVDATTPSAVVSVLSPTCSYRTNVTTCAACSVRVLYSCAGAH